jgi:hypothetical protein
MSTLVFRLKRDGVSTSYVDRLVLELINNDESFASLLANLLLEDVGKSIVSKKINELINTCGVVEYDTPERFYKTLCRQLFSEVESTFLSSAHLLRWALSNEATATHVAFMEYGVDSYKLTEVMCQLACGKYDNKTNV